MTPTPALFAGPRRKTNRTRGRTLHVQIITRFTACLRGPHLVGLIDGAQIPKQWSPVHRCWTISRRRVDDVIAYAEHAEGRVVTIEDQP